MKEKDAKKTSILFTLGFICLSGLVLVCVWQLIRYSVKVLGDEAFVYIVWFIIITLISPLVKDLYECIFKILKGK